MRRARRMAAGWAIAGALWILGPSTELRADLVRLKDGTELRCRIVEEGPRSVVVTTREGRREIPRDQILELERYADLDQVLKVLRGDLIRAVDKFPKDPGSRQLSVQAAGQLFQMSLAKAEVKKDAAAEYFFQKFIRSVSRSFSTFKKGFEQERSVYIRSAAVVLDKELEVSTDWGDVVSGQRAFDDLMDRLVGLRAVAAPYVDSDEAAFNGIRNEGEQSAQKIFTRRLSLAAKDEAGDPLALFNQNLARGVRLFSVETDRDKKLNGSALNISRTAARAVFDKNTK